MENQILKEFNCFPPLMFFYNNCHPWMTAGQDYPELFGKYGCIVGENNGDVSWVWNEKGKMALGDNEDYIENASREELYNMLMLTFAKTIGESNEWCKSLVEQLKKFIKLNYVKDLIINDDERLLDKEFMDMIFKVEYINANTLEEEELKEIIKTKIEK